MVGAAALLTLVACQRPVYPELQGFSSELPLVVLDTRGEDPDDADERITVQARFIELGSDGLATPDDAPAHEGPGGLRVRGNSSRDYDKKQYNFETWDPAGQDLDLSLLGLPAEEDWVLQGPYSDKSLMRNHLAYTWSRAVGRYAARTRFVELFIIDDERALSGEHYRGVYVLMEKIKRDEQRVDISKLRPEHDTEPELTGGYLIKRDWIDEEDEDEGLQVVLRTDTYNDALLLEDPEPPTDTQRRWILGWLNDFEGALAGPDFADPQRGYAAWIDAGSFIDHHLLVELCRNVDAFVLSTWMHKDRGGLLNMGPVWDFNGALGNADYFEASETDGWHHENPEFPADNPNGYRWYARLFEDPAFRQAWAERWAQLREGPLSDAALTADIRDTEALLTPAAARNFDRWPTLGRYVWPNDDGARGRSSYAEEVDYLEGWVLARAAWMDEAVWE